jgi:hypothetical protein
MCRKRGTFPTFDRYKTVSVAALDPISLTPRFSEVYGERYNHNRFSGLFASDKTAEAVGLAQVSLTPR